MLNDLSASCKLDGGVGACSKGNKTLHPIPKKISWFPGQRWTGVRRGVGGAGRAGHARLTTTGHSAGGEDKVVSVIYWVGVRLLQLLMSSSGIARHVDYDGQIWGRR